MLRVSIVGLDLGDHDGNSSYVDGPTGNPTEAIALDQEMADNNSRQGLSIACAKNAEVPDSTFTSTKSTSLKFCLDIETNNATYSMQDGALVSFPTRLRW